MSTSFTRNTLLNTIRLGDILLVTTAPGLSWNFPPRHQEEAMSVERDQQCRLCRGRVLAGGLFNQ